jgi:hypothetical protein
METPSRRSTSRRHWGRFVGTGAVALVAATTIGSAAGAATSPANPSVGASGSVAALSGSTMEVQNPNTGQTAVSWTPSTTFSKSVTEAVSSLAPGDCVTVTGTPSKSSKTTIAARSISVVAASATGSCTGQSPLGGGGATGGRPGPGAGGFRFGSGAGGAKGGTRPSFTPGSGRNVPNPASVAVATGKVKAVNGSTLSVSGLDLSPASFVRPKASTNSSKSSSTKTKKPSTPKTETLKITTTSATTVAATQSSAATDLAVGDCVSAFGPATTTGAVTATTVRITSTGGQSCTGSFTSGGGFFRGGGAGQGPGGSGA